MLDSTNALTLGLGLVLQPSVLALAVLGTLLGMVVGALPGLTSVMAIAILLPLTYALSPEQAFALLLPAYAAGTLGGSIAAVLLNIPGTGAAIMTAFDGYPMRLRGEAGRALGLVMLASFLGGMVSALFLALTAPLLARWALQLGTHEYLAVALFGLAVIAFISPSMLKGLFAGGVGLLLATVGTDPQTAYPRFTFERPELVSGLTFVPVMVGLFGVAEILVSVERTRPLSGAVPQRLHGLLPKLAELPRQAGVALRSILIGVGIGVMPAAGPTIASVVAYGLEKRIGRNREQMGKGAPEGLVAAETANNGATGASLVPMIALGIPGDAVTAIMIGALLIHGLKPGPWLMLERPDLVSSLFILFLLGNVLMLAIGFLGLKALVRVVSVPPRLLLPVVLSFCVIGSYATQNSAFDVLLMLLFGLVGYVMRKLDVPVAPLVLGFILGPLVEDYLRRVLVLDDGSVLGVFARPISGVLFSLMLVMLLSPLLQRLLREGRRRLRRTT